MSKADQKDKLLISIVNNGVARKAVAASKEAGAQGGTVLMGKGTASHLHELSSFFGIPIEPEKEIIFTHTCAENKDRILNALVTAGKLDKPGHGIAITLGLKKTAGISHLSTGEEPDRSLEGTDMEQTSTIQYDLIITIVNQGDADKVVDSSRKAGAQGGTILFGRGTGIHEHATLFGINIEPEKEVVLTLIDRQKTKQVMDAIIRETGLNTPGKGIALIIAVESVAGINSHLNKMVQEKYKESKRQ